MLLQMFAQMRRSNTQHVLFRQLITVLCVKQRHTTHPFALLCNTMFVAQCASICMHMHVCVCVCVFVCMFYASCLFQQIATNICVLVDTRQNDALVEIVVVYSFEP